MEKSKEQIQQLINQVNVLIKLAAKAEAHYEDQLKNVHPNFKKSAQNLVHYRFMRSMDIRKLQKDLGNMGLSRLAKAESHLMAGLQVTNAILKGFIEDKAINIKAHDLSVKKGQGLVKTNAKALLGYRSKGRRTRIMVTLPSEAAFDYQMVHDLIAKGMNCARINCAHDDEVIWKKMIQHIRKASKKLQRNCKITMDLGGPKIRTGPLQEGPKVRKYRPPKDIRGHITQALTVWLGPLPYIDPGFHHIPIDAEDLAKLEPGTSLYFRDARNKKRILNIRDSHELGFWGECPQTTYLETGILLYTDPKRKSKNPIHVGPFPAIEQPLLLKIGDHLRLIKSAKPGEPATYDAEGNLLSEAFISCTSLEIFDSVKPGESILFDDGKIQGRIKAVSPDEILVAIEYARGGLAKLRADKGINLPESDLDLSGLTEKDKRDLHFVVRHADVINFSFVNQPEDVRDLIKELEALNAKEKMGVIFKIETQKAFNNLTSILLEGMQLYPIGVMIARGDLAIETGWNNIGRVQEEILSLCQASHVPEIWATQVLENLAKLGIPSRAEITDATMAQRADCVMLNKGPFIQDALVLLDTILKDMEPYWEKNAPMLPAMEPANNPE